MLYFIIQLNDWCDYYWCNIFFLFIEIITIVLLVISNEWPQFAISKDVGYFNTYYKSLDILLSMYVIYFCYFNMFYRFIDSLYLINNNIFDIVFSKNNVLFWIRYIGIVTSLLLKYIFLQFHISKFVFSGF